MTAANGFEPSAGATAIREHARKSLIRIRADSLRQVAETARILSELAVARPPLDARMALRRTKRAATARIDAANAKLNLGEVFEALQFLEEALSELGDPEEAFLRVQVARALFVRGIVETEMTNVPAAIASYRELRRRFHTDRTRALRTVVARATLAEVALLGSNGEHEEALALASLLVSEIGAATAPSLQQATAEALRACFVELRSLGRFEAALATAEQIERRISTARDSASRIAVADAAYFRVLQLANLGRTAEAREVRRAATTRFANDADPFVMRLCELMTDLKI